MKLLGFVLNAVRFGILLSLGLGVSANACSPSTLPYRRVLDTADIVVKGRFEMHTEYVDGNLVGEIIIKPKRVIKWPRAMKKVALVVKVNTPALSDGINCPPWFFDEKVRYFLFDVENEELRLVGAYRN